MAAGLPTNKTGHPSGLPGSASGLDPLNCRSHRASSPSLGAASQFRCATANGHGCKVMDASAKDKELGDVLNWVVIGLIDVAVTAALFVPYIWELTRAG
jgi:hypothetical protein